MVAKQTNTRPNDWVKKCGQQKTRQFGSNGGRGAYVNDAEGQRNRNPPVLQQLQIEGDKRQETPRPNHGHGVENEDFRLDLFHRGGGDGDDGDDDEDEDDDEDAEEEQSADVAVVVAVVAVAVDVAVAVASAVVKEGRNRKFWQR